MLKKSLAAFAALAVALGMQAAATNPSMKAYSITPDMAAVKAGETIKFTFKFETQNDYVLRSCSAHIIRKNSPAEFFAKPEVKVKKSNYGKNYDRIDFGEVKVGIPQTKGEIPMVINTAGMPVGEYAVALQAYATAQGKKSIYPTLTLALAVTEADNAKFAPTPQTVPANMRKKAANPAVNPAAKPAAKAPVKIKDVKVSKAVLDKNTVKAGEKIQVSYEVELDEGCLVLSATPRMLRKGAANNFFETTQKTIRFRKKDKTPNAYDSVDLSPTVNNTTPGASGKFTYTIDTTGFPAGTYTAYVQCYAKRANKQSFYPGATFNFTVK